MWYGSIFEMHIRFENLKHHPEGESNFKTRVINLLTLGD